jgi:hypothetical protein
MCWLTQQRRQLEQTATMLWATRRKIRISRAATAWFVRRFVDPDAQFFFGTDQDVLAREAEGAIGFHCPGTRYPKKNQDGKTPLEALVAEHRPDDPALVRLAAAVREADGPAGQERLPEAPGLRLITVAFPDVVDDDQVIVEKSAIVYDCLYASLVKLTANPTA